MGVLFTLVILLFLIPVVLFISSGKKWIIQLSNLGGRKYTFFIIYHLHFFYSTTLSTFYNKWIILVEFIIPIILDEDVDATFSFCFPHGTPKSNIRMFSVWKVMLMFLMRSEFVRAVKKLTVLSVLPSITVWKEMVFLNIKKVFYITYSYSFPSLFLTKKFK